MPAAKVTTPNGMNTLFTTSMRKYCVAERHSARISGPGNHVGEQSDRQRERTDNQQFAIESGDSRM